MALLGPRAKTKLGLQERFELRKISAAWRHIIAQNVRACVRTRLQNFPVGRGSEFDSNSAVKRRLRIKPGAQAPGKVDN